MIPEQPYIYRAAENHETSKRFMQQHMGYMSKPRGCAGTSGGSRAIFSKGKIVGEPARTWQGARFFACECKKLVDVYCYRLKER